MPGKYQAIRYQHQGKGPATLKERRQVLQEELKTKELADQEKILQQKTIEEWGKEYFDWFKEDITFGRHPLPDPATTSQKDIFYISTGLVQQTVQIVIRYGHTI